MNLFQAVMNVIALGSGIIVLEMAVRENYFHWVVIASFMISVSVVTLVYQGQRKS